MQCSLEPSGVRESPIPLANQKCHVSKEWNAKVAAGNVCYVPGDHASWHYVRQAFVETLALQKSVSRPIQLNVLGQVDGKISPGGLYRSLGSCT